LNDFLDWQVESENLVHIGAKGRTATLSFLYQQLLFSLTIVLLIRIILIIDLFMPFCTILGNSHQSIIATGISLISLVQNLVVANIFFSPFYE